MFFTLYTENKTTYFLFSYISMYFLTANKKLKEEIKQTRTDMFLIRENGNLK